MWVLVGEDGPRAVEDDWAVRTMGERG